MNFASRGVFVAMVTAGFCTASVARAEEPKENPDVKFVKEANMINLTEIEIGKLVPDRTVNAAIKRYGQQLGRDHRQMSEELTAMARKKGIILDKELDSKHREMVDKLSALKGAEFDRALSRMMIEGHEKAVEKFDAEVKNGRDADVKSWAEKRVETLREHLKTARNTLTSG